jgi:hypothetical protein
MQGLTWDPPGACTGSTLCDDYLVLHVPSDYDSLIETVFKTELVVLLMEKAREQGSAINLEFSDTYAWDSLPTAGGAGPGADRPFASWAVSRTKSKRAKRPKSHL